MSVGVLVLAGGSGSRFGAGRNKVYLPLAGRSVLAWSVGTLLRVPDVAVLVLVTRPADRGFVARLLATEVDRSAGPEVAVVAGGASRQESELCGLRRLAGHIQAGQLDTVLIHDGARPLASAELASAVVAAARAHGGAVPGVPRGDLARADPTGGLRAGVGRDTLVAVQTPQGFAATPLLAAYQRAAADGYAGTDTASCVRRYTDLPVRWVPGDPHNIKITYPHDLTLAEALLTRPPA